MSETAELSRALVRPIASPAQSSVLADGRIDRILNTLGAWTLGILWLAPLLYAVWTAFHPSAYSTRFELFAPLTLENFRAAWAAAPFPRYFLNTSILVATILAGQLVLGTLAAYALMRAIFCLLVECS